MGPMLQLTAAAEYFDMTEKQKDTLLGGALAAAFFTVGAPAALLVSATRLHRTPARLPARLPACPSHVAEPGT